MMKVLFLSTCICGLRYMLRICYILTKQSGTFERLYTGNFEENDPSSYYTHIRTTHTHTQLGY